MLFVLVKGRAVRDGAETDLHEAPAWELLHAGKGLLQSPLHGVVYLQSAWLWMVSDSFDVGGDVL